MLKVAAAIIAKAKFEEVSNVADRQDGQKLTLGMMWAKHSLDLAVKERDSAISHVAVLREEMNRLEAAARDMIADLDKRIAE